MTEHETTPEKRLRGRPSLRTQQETRTLLIKAAGDVFLSEGYAGTSIEAVARKAGMSTRTIYKTVSNKADLFRLVADDAIQTSIAYLDTPLDATTPESAILALSHAYSHLVLSNDGVLKARAVFAEQAQFPEFRDNYLSSIHKVAHAFDQRFVALISVAYPLDVIDLYEGAALLRSMINGAQREAVLNPSYDSTTADISGWSDKCTHFVIRSLRSAKAVGT
ncbi:TetR/AcrR family transcriptional regulator [Falsihalocynthiibacter arcticus]|uniref:HTH tetR-type domain-containing protein n=1 Tax=Falsihalocynthiibacter arcticus TaxID=1579316 RepID=A0A126V592_9RHOB|nr:TetR/AcrR family transcriptional regulator [Falsihalocynthiibacter arcticus]AML53046.1 hypothetical protein RC74_18855 [Falsihalocynthiibacter arcticus]